MARLGEIGLLKGYLDGEEGLIVWLSQPEQFYQNWPSYLTDCGADIYEVRNETKSLASIFERITQ